MEMKRRTGDTVTIPGDYQHRALNQGHPIQRFWHASKHLVIDAFLPPAPSDTVVDVGCGSGVISDHLGKSGATVTGVDANRDAVRFAERQYGRDNVQFVNALVDTTFPVKGLVDKIYCLELIEHIYRDQGLNMLEIFHSNLADGGKVFLTTPNYRSMWPLIEYLMDASGRFPELSGPQHVEHYTPKKLTALCEEAGFAVKKLTSFCGIAPWVAGLSWSLATRLHSLETRIPFTPGSILLAILEKEKK